MTSLRRNFGWLFAISAIGYLFSFGNQLVTSYHFGTSASIDEYWTLLAMASAFMFYVQPVREALISPVFQAAVTDRSRAWALYSAGLAIQSILAVMSTGLFLVMPTDLMAWLGLGGAGSQGLWLDFLPYFVLYALAETCNGLLLSFNRVLYQSTARLISAMIALLSLILLAESIGISALVVGLLASQATTLIVSFIGLRREGVAFVWAGFSPLFRETKFLPMLLSLLINYLVAQVYVIFERITMHNMASGLVSSFQYGTALVNVGISLLVSPVFNIIWPQFLSKAEGGDIENSLKFAENVLAPLCFTLAVGCAFVHRFAPKIVQLIYAGGQFDANSVAMTSDALRATIFTALPIAVYGVYTRLLLTTGQTLSFVASSIATSVAGMAVIFLASYTDNVSLIRWHWFVANLAGSLAVMIAMLVCFVSTRQSFGRALLWCLKACGVVLISLLSLPAIVSDLEKIELAIALFLRFGTMVIVAFLIAPFIGVLNIKSALGRK